MTTRGVMTRSVFLLPSAAPLREEAAFVSFPVRFAVRRPLPGSYRRLCGEAFGGGSLGRSVAVKPVTRRAVLVASWASAPRPMPLSPGAGVGILLTAIVAVAAATIGSLAAAARNRVAAPVAAVAASSVGTAASLPRPKSLQPPAVASRPRDAREGKSTTDTAPPPPTIGILRMAFLAFFRTPGFWAAPLRVLPVAAAALGSPDVITITFLRRPVLTAILSASATATALGAPESTLSVEAVHSTARRALEPPPARRRDAAAIAEEERQEAAIVPVLLRHMRAALTHTWWTATAKMIARLDRAIGEELATAIAKAAAAETTAKAPAGSDGGGDGDDSGAELELFETTSKMVLRAGVSAFLGDAFADTHGDEVWAGLREWQLSAWTLPWVLFPRLSRRLRPALLASHARAYTPILATVTAVLDGSTPAEEGTYLADAVDAVAAAGLGGQVSPVHVATQIFGVLVAMHINTYATGAWAVAHVATDAGLTDAVTAEVDALEDGRAPPIAADGPSPTGLPVLEAVWIEAMRVYQVAPSIRLAKAPYHVAASGTAKTGHPGWTIPGDGRIVAACIGDLNTGAAYHGPTASTVDPHRYVPPVGPCRRSWQAAAHDRRLFNFAWGPHGCIGRRVAEVTLQRVWAAFYRSHSVQLVGGPQLPPADFVQAAATAIPVAPVHVRLVQRATGVGG